MFLAIPATIYIPIPVIIGFAAVIAAAVIGVSLMNRKKTAAPAPAAAPMAAPAAAPVAAAAAPLAPGSAGALKLYDTPPKTAAMVMAIVADKLGKPINELRFVSIKEVK